LITEFPVNFKHFFYLLILDSLISSVVFKKRSLS